VTGEEQVAAGAEHARLRRRLERRLADDLAGLEVHRPQGAVGGDAALLGATGRQADIVLLLVHGRLAGGAVKSGLGAGDIDGHPLLVEGRREEGRRAVPPRTSFLARLFAHHTDARIGLDRSGGIVVDRLAGLRIDALGPGDLLLVLVGAQELAVGAVERVV